MFIKRIKYPMASGLLVAVALLFISPACQNNRGAEEAGSAHWQPKTFCNPLDIDYTFSVVSTSRGLSYRSGADPAVIQYRGEFYMFVTRSQGYWHSGDLRSWEFIHPARWYFESSNAPGAWSADSTILMMANPSGYMSLITASDPVKGNWQAQPSIIPIEVHDPALFVDDDGKTYLYEGSSNVYPITGVELDPENYYLPKGEPVPLFNLQPALHGWERFGENHISNIGPFIEGAWMTKHNGKYYLQYAAPGTQWNVYADGVYTGDRPLGPFKYAPYNPVSYKPGGFITGAGHGSTVQDNRGEYWHFATMRISVNYLMERRIGMFPAGFEEDGQMYVNTAYGDYPHLLPGEPTGSHRDGFAGWMLLSYKKPVTASSIKKEEKMNRFDESRGGWMLPFEHINFSPSHVTDENIRTFWVAQTNGENEWLEIDLQEDAEVFAAQINYMDFNSNVFGKPDTLYHQFIIEYSADRTDWRVAADYSENRRDQPNAYVEFESPVAARYVRFRNVHVPVPNLAISGFRLFGKGSGSPPAPPSGLMVERDKDERNARITWSPAENATGYKIYWGIGPDKLNNSVMVYDTTSYELRALNSAQYYYFTIEAFNENGISSKVIPLGLKE